MDTRIKKLIIIQFRIIHFITSLKLVAQCSVFDGRTTHPVITHTLCVCVCVCVCECVLAGSQHTLTHNAIPCVLLHGEHKDRFTF